MSNNGLFTGLGIAGLGLAFAAPADAQLLARKDLSLAAALTIATTAADLCKSQGYTVSVTVVGRNGEVILQMRGDNAPPHTVENSFRKAYSARTFRVPSGELVQRVKDNPTAPFVHLSNVVAAQGALPIKAGDDVIGAVGVSGAPGGEKDEVCAKAGIDKAADTLK
ncbi:MAG TPA: heme-binding protein [Reyranella sp.]|nr:heme-binding protein [Reyranella sp.]